MSLRPLDEILKAFPNIDDEDRLIAEKLHKALSGEVKRDILRNHGDHVTPTTLDDISRRFGEFMDDTKNQNFFLKKTDG